MAILVEKIGRITGKKDEDVSVFTFDYGRVAVDSDLKSEQRLYLHN